MASQAEASLRRAFKLKNQNLAQITTIQQAQQNFGRLSSQCSQEGGYDEGLEDVHHSCGGFPSIMDTLHTHGYLVRKCYH